MTNQEAIGKLKFELLGMETAISSTEKCFEHVKESYAEYVEALDMAISALEKQEREKWHSINLDEPKSFPDDDRLILVSFSNCDGIDIARWRTDLEGGMFCPGDEDYPYTRSGIFVNAWRERPERYGDND